MGFFSAIGNAALSSGAGILASAFQSMTNRRLMKYQYDLNQRSLIDSPSSQKAGLIRAGYNPMLAITHGIASPTVGGSSVSAPDLSSFSAAKQAKEMTEISKKTAEVNNDATIANTAADVDLKKAQAEKIRRESDSISPPARKAHDYISAGKDVVAPILGAAATAYGAKKGVEIATKAMKDVGIKNAREVAKASVKAAVVNSAKSAAGVAAKTASPFVGYYGGKYGEDVSRRRYDHQRGKSWSTIFSKRPLTH